ncbi:DNA circularization N-terminal domain-containing protein [Herbaspirillum chlorophenolicum]|uniref:DNA circularization N-terminal domain-containing protein n=1 Tax=Herbaspirillum chlorophenolicum TaxID=211589 RepID=UPI00067B27BC|nr:DNA circularization N-terminal domain-containing protein [Herbaspirillum chlorophenolicum]
MNYVDRMATANWRGFDFLSDGHAAKGGRRLAINEFPGAEQPLVKDMGGKAWDYKLNAYFIGQDYDLERNGFLEKLNTPGADWLLHPWLGWIWVRVRDWDVAETNDKGGYCTVAIEFVPGGEQPYVVAADKVDVAIDKTHQLSDAAEADFSLEPMSADGMTSFIAAVSQQLEGVRNLISLAKLPLTWANQVMGVINGIKGDINTLMAIPQQYANMLRGFADLFGSVDTDDLDATSRPRVVTRLASMATTPRIPELTGVAATDGAVIRNLVRESDLRSRLLVSATAQVAIAEYKTEEDRDAVLTSTVNAIDTLLPNLPDPVFQAAVSVRTAVMEALMVQDLKPAVVRDVVKSLPAVVLAYRLQIDEDVFLARNKVRHPLFVKGEING